jgi:hypothetical protein
MNTIFKRYFMTGILPVLVVSSATATDFDNTVDVSIVNAILTDNLHVLSGIWDTRNIDKQLNLSFSAPLTSLRINLPLSEINGETPLTFAARNGKNIIVEYLIANGANIAKQNQRGQTPVVAAACGGFLDTVTFLLNLECDVSVADYQGVTLLHWVAYYAFPTDVIELVINRGAVINALDNRKQAPLEWALQLSNIDDQSRKCCLDVLLSKGGFVAQEKLAAYSGFCSPKIKYWITYIKQYWSKNRDAWIVAVMRSVIRGPRIEPVD